MDNNQKLEDVKLLIILPRLYDWGNIVEKLGEDGMMSLQEVIEELDEKGMEVGCDVGQLTVDWNHNRNMHGKLANHTEALRNHGFEFMDAEFISKGDENGWQSGYFRFSPHLVKLS